MLFPKSTESNNLTEEGARVKRLQLLREAGDRVGKSSYRVALGQRHISPVSRPALALPCSYWLLDTTLHPADPTHLLCWFCGCGVGPGKCHTPAGQPLPRLCPLSLGAPRSSHSLCPSDHCPHMPGSSAPCSTLSLTMFLLSCHSSHVRQE